MPEAVPAQIPQQKWRRAREAIAEQSAHGDPMVHFAVVRKRATHHCQGRGAYVRTTFRGAVSQSDAVFPCLPLSHVFAALDALG